MPDHPTTRRRGAFDRFLARRASLLIASLAIICVTVATVLLGALVIYRYDESEYATYGQALWFTLQTATTVGYGDMTPQRTVGRIVAAAVMLVSLALLTVMTATITSYFIERSTRAGDQSVHDHSGSSWTRPERLARSSPTVDRDELFLAVESSGVNLVLPVNVEWT